MGNSQRNINAAKPFQRSNIDRRLQTVSGIAGYGGDGRHLRCFFAGVAEAIHTVIKPLMPPHKIPIGLIFHRGRALNSSPTHKCKNKQSPQVRITPKTRPKGIANLHQFKASNRTSFMICCLLAPKQRNIP